MRRAIASRAGFAALAVAVGMAMASCSPSSQTTEVRIPSPEVPIGVRKTEAGWECRYGRVDFVGALEYSADSGDILDHGRFCAGDAASRERLLLGLVNLTAAAGQIGAAFAACMTERVGKDFKVVRMEIAPAISEWRACAGDG